MMMMMIVMMMMMVMAMIVMMIVMMMMVMMMVMVMIVIVIVIIVMMMNIGRQTLSWVPLQRFIMNAIFLKTKMMLMLIMMLMMGSNPIKEAKACQGHILYNRHLTNVQPAGDA